MQKLKELLDQKGIKYSQSYNQDEFRIGVYPKIIIIYKCDRDYIKPNYPHTGKFYYAISWNDWKKSSSPKSKDVETPSKAMKIIKNVMYELGISNNTEQETLFF